MVRLDARRLNEASDKLLRYIVRGADILRILLLSAMSITSSGSSPHKCRRELINFLQAGHDRPNDEFLSRLRYTSCAHLKKINSKKKIERNFQIRI